MADRPGRPLANSHVELFAPHGVVAQCLAPQRYRLVQVISHGLPGSSWSDLPRESLGLLNRPIFGESNFNCARPRDGKSPGRPCRDGAAPRASWTSQFLVEVTTSPSAPQIPVPTPVACGGFVGYSTQCDLDWPNNLYTSGATSFSPAPANPLHSAGQRHIP